MMEGVKCCLFSMLNSSENISLALTSHCANKNSHIIEAECNKYVIDHQQNTIFESFTLTPQIPYNTKTINLTTGREKS